MRRPEYHPGSRVTVATAVHCVICSSCEAMSLLTAMVPAASKVSRNVRPRLLSDGELAATPLEFSATVCEACGKREAHFRWDAFVGDFRCCTCGVRSVMGQRLTAVHRIHGIVRVFTWFLLDPVLPVPKSLAFIPLIAELIQCGCVMVLQVRFLQVRSTAGTCRVFAASFDRRFWLLETKGDECLR